MGKYPEHGGNVQAKIEEMVGKTEKVAQFLKEKEEQTHKK